MSQYSTKILQTVGKTADLQLPLLTHIPRSTIDDTDDEAGAMTPSRKSIPRPGPSSEPQVRSVLHREIVARVAVPTS